MRLFTIGDSISQGFMSGSAARTECSYSTLLSEWLGIDGYRYPAWHEPGLPASVEAIFRALNNKFGSSISGIEWIKSLKVINGVMDKAEDYYERGEGGKDKKYPGNVPFFHNIGVRDWTVADSWLITPDVCRKMIGRSWIGEVTDGFLANPSAFIYRTGLKVLDPNLDCNRSQLDWLEYHASGEGVENLLLWLGANNALKTVVTLKIKESPNNPSRRPHQMTHEERSDAGWNLWHPADFKAEYAEFIKRVDTIMKRNTSKKYNVYVGTIPCVTAIPILTGLGKVKEVPGMGKYYTYYTYFPFDEKFAVDSGKYLSMDDAIKIDSTIMEYNKSIKELAEARGFHVVDFAERFTKMAWQRNDGKPTYPFPEEWKKWPHFPDSRYYHADENGKMLRGGLFTMDGIHPSALAHGLLASEFRNVMEAAGVEFKKSIDWEKIRKTDTLYESPITLMGELYRHEKLAHFVAKILNLLK
ncbi:MAG: hypothetical protein JNL74_12620 [Fibrobacteres bacterium]|nr:hypothetical protein [Fibrobacterota bacterium]